MSQRRTVSTTARLISWSLPPARTSATNCSPQPISQSAFCGVRQRAGEVVDDLVGVPREAVQRVDVRPLPRGQQQRRQVVRLAVPRVEPPAGLVRRAQRGVGDPGGVQLSRAHAASLAERRRRPPCAAASAGGRRPAARAAPRSGPAAAARRSAARPGTARPTRPPARAARARARDRRERQQPPQQVPGLHGRGQAATASSAAPSARSGPSARRGEQQDGGDARRRAACRRSVAAPSPCGTPSACSARPIPYTGDSRLGPSTPAAAVRSQPGPSPVARCAARAVARGGGATTASGRTRSRRREDGQRGQRRHLHQAAEHDERAPRGRAGRAAPARRAAARAMQRLVVRAADAVQQHERVGEPQPERRSGRGPGPAVAAPRRRAAARRPRAGAAAARPARRAARSAPRRARASSRNSGPYGLGAPAYAAATLSASGPGTAAARVAYGSSAGQRERRPARRTRRRRG